MAEWLQSADPQVLLRGVLALHRRANVVLCGRGGVTCALRSKFAGETGGPPKTPRAHDDVPLARTDTSHGNVVVVGLRGDHDTANAGIVTRARLDGVLGLVGEPITTLLH